MPGSSPPWSVRRASPDDAAACAAVHHASWVETYATLLPAGHWRSDTQERRTATWRRWLAGDGVVPVVESGARIVGLAFAAASRHVGEHQPVRVREVYLLYVLASYHGTGAGQALLDVVVPPHEPGQLWVAESNPRARRFYERNGFVPDGARTVDEQLGLAVVRHVR
ncbi:GNAT family N-acetyltransferase [Cellulomonas sp. JZ18]|uniref:GNAT family N-acetyltransferase n=1 Tax=Cellulomonas sp. JZ18 TaxID=2654191 RepID=UPI0012D3E885|nr:GNAT family N-acetyltransferase [Cellulomonas sp. JZ18]QGQ19118.1 GNAT family N-acetyltransferase [Cellulomonas sp. JZ18]